MRKTILIVSLCLATGLIAQNGKYALGARGSGMGGASLTVGDQWALFNNVGALGLNTQSAAFTSYQNRFDLAEFQVVGGGYVHNLDKMTGGIGVYRFGDDLFSEQRIHVAFGHKLDRISLGVGVDYLQYNIATVGSRGAMILEFGGVAMISEQLHFGAHISNVNQAKLISDQDEFLPTVMKAGFSFRPNDQLMINLETEKDLDFDEVFRLGMEYQIIENLYMRTGFNTAPFKGAFGVGFKPKQFELDYSFSSDTNLGSIHEFSVSYLIQK